MKIQIEDNARSFQIRRAVRTDANAIARLFLIASDGLVAYIWSRDKPEDVALLDHGAARYARTNTAFSFENCHVATIGTDIVGMIHAFQMPESDGSVEDDPILSPYADLEVPGSLYVSGLAISEPFRGQGIGSALLAQAEEQAATYGQISLICFEANDGATRLYRARGYLEVMRRPLVPHATLKYTKGDALLLVRQIAGNCPIGQSGSEDLHHGDRVSRC